MGIAHGPSRLPTPHILPRKDIYVPFRLPHQFFLLISFPRTPQEGIFSLIGSVWSSRVVTPSIPPRFDLIRFEASISAASGILEWSGRRREGQKEGNERASDRALRGAMRGIS
jgi:hypothetical protein